MKTAIKLLFPILLLSCTNPSQKNKTIQKDSTANLALQLIYNKIDKHILDSATIQLKVNVEFEGQQEDKWVYAASFQTTYNTSTLDIGSIGIGSTKEKAEEICIQEWFAAFGIPFTMLLNNQVPLQISNLQIFPGLMSIRGTLPENTWLKGNGEMTKKIISQIQPQITAAPGDIIPVDIKLKIGKNGIVDGECRLSNQVSPELLTSLKQINWPSSNEEFIFKQFYLIKKKG